ncbi:DNRLRE domain-containing protein [Chitinophaga rhizophila]|uniref:DNRLRE domain-containing protein n=1 Tax=Chitinophaga rhizophila TaxID=2866212 RepID=A0ABS7GLR8_9BACT|nr:DNRLRE domain-containing protein [Chitinophaga rhizophila]MBW8688215.1 DNRLRE domain-containing protein [Chitinophaga rhizophila]
MKMKQLLLCMSAMTMLAFAGCRKENSDAKLPAASPDSELAAKLTTGVHSLELTALASSTQYDCLVNSNPPYAGVNLVSNPDLGTSAWTYSGTVGISRDFFGFSGIGFLPPGTTVTSAILTLSGLAPGTAVANPLGNSFYPGSPYSSYGSNAAYIRRVTGPWNENTITWNNQPATTVTNQVAVPASTTQWNYGVTLNVTSLVQDIVNSGQNYGFALQLQVENYYRNLNFAGSRNSDPARRPKLSITYSIP